MKTPKQLGEEKATQARGDDIIVHFTPSEAVLVVAALQARVRADRGILEKNASPLAELHRVFIDRGEAVLAKIYRASAVGEGAQ